MIVVSGGGGSVIVYEYDAGKGSVPAVLTVRTWNEWPPSASPLEACGVVHSAKAATSSAHSNVAPAGVPRVVFMVDVQELRPATRGRAAVRRMCASCVKQHAVPRSARLTTRLRES